MRVRHRRKKEEEKVIITQEQKKAKKRHWREKVINNLKEKPCLIIGAIGQGTLLKIVEQT